MFTPLIRLSKTLRIYKHRAGVKTRSNLTKRNQLKNTIMNAKLTAKIKTFSAEIKEKSGSFFSSELSYNSLVIVNQKYNSVLRKKRNEINAGYNDPFYGFDAKNTDTGLIERYVLRPSHELSNDQILQIIVCVELFYLSYQDIKAIIK